MDKRALLLAPLFAWLACGGSGSTNLFGGTTGSGGDDNSVGSGIGPSVSSGPSASASSGGSPTTTASGSSGSGGGVTSSSGSTGETSSSGGLGGATNTTAIAASSSAAGTGGAGGVVDPLLIDDMEDGDQRILNVSGRTGYWYAENDGTGAQVPAPLSTFLPTSVVPPRGTSTKAMHVTGTAFTNWGAVTKVDFNNAVSGVLGDVGSPQPYNVTGFTGIAFWAQGTSVRFEVRQRNITLVVEGGSCSVDCSDFYGAPLTLTPTWTFYALDFSALAQRGFGTQVTFTPTDVVGVQFVTAGPSFDFWIDDIRFY